MGYVDGLLAKNEKIVVQTRQHWIVLLSAIIANGFLFVLLLALLIFISAAPILRGSAARSFVLFFLFIITLAPVFGLGRGFLAWWNEEYVVTNRRVIQAEGILAKQVIDSSLDKVNDVVLTQSFLGRLFDYGNIEILTASEVGVNYFRAIHAPVKFKMAMMEQREGMAADVAQYERAEPDVATLIRELEELHQQGVLNDAEYREKKRQLLARM